MKRLVLWALLFPLAAFAQVHKCAGPGGKVILTDKPCAPADSLGVMVVRPNTLDTSEGHAANARQLDAIEASQIAANPPAQCRFKAFKYGDKQGQLLRDRATQECVQNIIAAKQGKPTSTEAYQMWRDHFNQTSNDRNAALARAAADQNARMIANSNQAAIEKVGRDVQNKLDQPMTCKRSVLNSSELTCK